MSARPDTQFRTADEATAALGLDGEKFQDVEMRIKRPKDYIGIDPSLGVMPGMSTDPDAAGNNKLFVGGIPPYLGDEQVMELLKSFGELKTFNLVKDTVGGEAGVSKVSQSKAHSPESV